MFSRQLLARAQPRHGGSVLWLAMQQYVTPFLPVLGAFSASALTFWATSHKDKVDWERSNVEWERSEHTRLGKMRKKAYADYAAAQKRDMITCRRMAAGLGFYDSASKITEDEGLARLSKLGDDRNVSFENLRLVGSEQAVAAARQWHDAVLALRKFARNDGDSRNRDFPKLYEEAGLAGDRFYEAARRDLDVPGVVSTPSTDEMSTAEE